ncbi:short-chain dehydrogenase [Stemphylium lycopersici]|uniref:Short-chain dehydrogenase n=1 Tax=Stemphylium lycopersici TaxID=183478 RepID=A0A364N2Z3_STELY|nr:short-chain dehydrogenase [Stemphylium lycopersici]
MRRSALSIAAFAGLVAAQDSDQLSPNNTAVAISSCQSLTCNSPNDTICSGESRPGVPSTVGIVANAVNTSSINLSYTLVTGLDSPGFTGIGSSQYEYSDAQLFVGLDPNLNGDDYPSGCALMIQYNAQTFPLETLPDDDTREGMYENTTSCNGVIDTFCQASLTSMIMDFESSSSNTSTSTGDRCTQLTSYVNEQLRTTGGACGQEGTWLAAFMNVTGGSLPSASSSNDDLSDQLGSGDCYPVLPQSYQLSKVAEMRHLYYGDPPNSDQDFYDNINAGLAGWTPVITVLYDGDDDAEVLENGVQFSCLNTFQPNGDETENPYESTGGAGALSGYMCSLTPLGLAGFWLLYNIMG